MPDFATELPTLRSTPEGVILPVHAQPGARRAGITGLHNGRVKVCVTEVAEKGKANEALERLLAKTFHLSRSSVNLIRGGTSHSKDFCLSGIDQPTVEAHLRESLPSKR